MFALTVERDQICNRPLEALGCIDYTTYRTVEEFHCGVWPTSLACRYMQATRDENNYDVLARIVGEADPENTPPDDAAVAHLRVGDVLEPDPWIGDTTWMSVYDILHGSPICSNFQVDAFHGGQNRACYVKNLAYYERKVTELPSNVRTVYLVAGSQFQRDFARSSEYIRGIRDFFLSQGFRVYLRLGGNPDDDVIFIGRAKYFIQGGGGFSVLLAGLVQSLGGTVLASDPVVGRNLGEESTS
jgi:hypothetical protein